MAKYFAHLHSYTQLTKKKQDFFFIAVCTQYLILCYMLTLQDLMLYNRLSISEQTAGGAIRILHSLVRQDLPRLCE